ncbi:MAG: hypothetical protein Q7T86_18730 [Hyphomicrobiaceae bacterium]|nr:hypothetical protein [Hyphomicrobiaceae bacterium]
MKDRRLFKPLTVALDAATGLAIFLLIAGMLSSSCEGHDVRLSDMISPAHAAHLGAATSSWAQPTAQSMPLAMVKTYPGQVFRGTNRATAFMVLGGVFTLLFVGNVALYRHLRSQYSRPRRRRALGQATEL